MAGKMDRRTFLTALGAGAAVLGLPRLSFAQPSGRRTNVLFIAVDDLRPQLGCYGHEQMISPHIDRLANEGVAFRHAYCQQAVCAPSRASLLTGARPDTTTIYNLFTPVRKAMPDVLTLPEHFKKNGYTSISLGKIYHHWNDDRQGWSEKAWHPGGPGYLLPENRALDDYQKRMSAGKVFSDRGPATEAADVPENAYPDGKTADEAIEMLRGFGEAPFFLAVGFYKPHLPFNAPKRYWDIYDPDAIDLADNPFKPKDCPTIAMHNWAELRGYRGIPKSGRLSDDHARHLIHGYYACTSFTDALVGRLVAELDRLGLRDSTVVILWGDHGWNLGEHGLWCKHSNFETSVHSPLIVRAPGMQGNGHASDALVEFVDIYPSLSELCGLPLPGHLEGTSFVPLLQEPDKAWKEAAFSQYPRGRIMGYSMRTGRYRYTEWINGETKAVQARELYDHLSDPGENVSLALDPAYEGLMADLSSRLRKELKIEAAG